MKAVPTFLAVSLFAAPAFAGGVDVTVGFASLTSGLDQGKVVVDYEIPEEGWGQLRGFGLTQLQLIVTTVRTSDGARFFQYALPLNKRAGHLVTAPIDFADADAWELEIVGFGRNYRAVAIGLGDGNHATLRWNVAAPPAAPAAVIDPRVIKTCHEELKYVGPDTVAQCNELFRGIEGGSAQAAILECKNANKHIGPEAVMRCLKQAAGR